MSVGAAIAVPTATAGVALLPVLPLLVCVLAADGSTAFVNRAVVR
jgi:hypothetical protein